MAFIEERSEQGMLLEDHLFYLPTTLTERWNYSEQRLGTITSTFDDCPDFSWQITPSENELISLADIRFECDLFVTGADGKALNAEHLITPINNIIHSLFQSVTVELGGRSISDASNLYFMRSYLENLLGFSSGAQKSQLTCEGFYLDHSFTAPQNGTWIAAANGIPGRANFNNDGAKSRYNMLLAGSPVQLSGKIHSDIFQQDKPLLTGVPLFIKLTRARTQLSFTAVDAAHLPKVAIRNPRLYIRKFEMTASYSNALAKQLLTSNAVYHIERVAMRHMTLNAGQQFAAWNNVTQGQIPKIMILGMVSSNALAGTHDTTPYNFQHFDLMSIYAEINGKIYPNNSYDLNFPNHFSLQAYEGLLDTLGRLNEPSGELVFDRHKYNNGYTLFGFDFTSSHTGLNSVALVKQGNLNIHLKFRVDLPETIVVFAMLVYDNVIEITNNRDIIFNFTT